ncbi:hypothetical protein [Ferruginibacter albus]|uniref:hypothetical protein n=1 Tax=Ferruginibacter albus TaxID=2875540 RepID=UPI001CC4B63C|nr:hypothetical protein [Ferruginibacter albus]UAY52265.1 hypothetical protein K9M53_00890 [Ferruginibacter albus]
MRKTYTITFLLITLAWLSSCTKDTDVFIADAGQITQPDSTWYSSLTSNMPINDLQKGLQLRPDVDTITIDGINDNSIYSSSGLSCTIPANSLIDSNGIPVTGTINIESYLLQKKGELLRMGLPTVCNGKLLVSQGVFSIEAKKDGQKLKFADSAILSFSYPRIITNPQQAVQKVQLFAGSDTNGQFNWNLLPPNDSSNFILPTDQLYFSNITYANLKWINCDYFYADTLAGKITIAVKLPPYFTNVNTSVSIVFDDIRSVTGAFPDIASKKFKSDKLPVGLNAKIVTVTKDGNFYYLGTKEFTTEPPSSDDGTQLVNVTPGRCTLNDINTLLNSL